MATTEQARETLRNAQNIYRHGIVAIESIKTMRTYAGRLGAAGVMSQLNATECALRSITELIGALYPQDKGWQDERS